MEGSQDGTLGKGWVLGKGSVPEGCGHGTAPRGSGHSPDLLELREHWDTALRHWL